MRVECQFSINHSSSIPSSPIYFLIMRYGFITQLFLDISMSINWKKQRSSSDFTYLCRSKFIYSKLDYALLWAQKLWLTTFSRIEKRDKPKVVTRANTTPKAPNQVIDDTDNCPTTIPPRPAPTANPNCIIDWFRSSKTSEDSGWNVAKLYCCVAPEDHPANDQMIRI